VTLYGCLHLGDLSLTQLFHSWWTCLVPVTPMTALLYDVAYDAWRRQSHSHRLTSVPNLHQPSQEGEEAWGSEIRRLAIHTNAFIESCTPSYDRTLSLE
jgi:hypothetical protein